MSHNPAVEPCSAEYHNPECCMICGPAGNDTLINQNEKGILEQNIFDVQMKTAELSATHQKWNV